MKNSIKNIYIEEIYEKIVVNKLTNGEILSILEENSGILNSFLLYYITIIKNDIVLGEKILELSELRNEKIVDKFKKTTENKQEESFLLNLDYLDKKYLLSGIYNFSIEHKFDNIPYPELIKYTSKIKKLIEEDENNNEMKNIITTLKEQDKELTKIYFQDMKELKTTLIKK